MVKQLRTLQLSLRPNFHDEIKLRDKTLEAITAIPECRLACMMPEQSLSSVINNVRGAIGMTSNAEPIPDQAMFVNCRFHRNHDRSGCPSGRYGFRGNQPGLRDILNDRSKKCYIWKKIGYRPWKHTDEEK